MKKIGFIDYYLSEWHANNYPIWMKEAAEKLGLEYKIAYAWAEKSPSPLDGITSEEWCKSFGVELCESIEELCEKSDYIVILAPSDPDKHLEYAERALKFGKPTYIDKTFAPDLKTAEKIFELGKKYGAPFFSSSALRYATELEPLAGKCEKVSIKGGGSNPEEYIIHQIEMLVKCIGTGAKDIKVTKQDNTLQIEAIYPDERCGELLFEDDFYDFIISAKTHTGNTFDAKIESPFFKNLIENILTFFDCGILPFDSAETLEVMKIREMFIRKMNEQ